ncbi:dihydrodipicolinate synthase/N-acetylneuraminate lyase [Pseudonocardia hierapolitana]|uniref:Dihydrodipicolinate synthase/N-acetylneuraminate lyase n=1 Tax=Pseudonocardia hierapolitana TaxID=1128676 RepID=A0A561T3K2_9PSEU|nr:dihydrodipicolinate synthase family protein [Pseudonocardia hierapolitana]TWF81693.1 dihydrodipicolinate synthase/N-acetylneuraminate lyase [Pseudonocardia hierapolitana]
MEPLTASALRGVWATVLLPLRDDESIDLDVIASALDHVLASGVQGVYTNGTAGEFHTLTEAEYDRLHALVADRCAAAGVPFQLGASHPSGQLSLDRIARAAALRPGAIQVVLPDWLPLSEEEVLAAVDRMAAVADGVPLVLYNPPYAKTQVPPELFGKLADEIPALVGAKVPGGDDAWYARMADAVGGRLAIFVAGHTLASGYARGAAGAYSNVACLSPGGAARWYAQITTDLPAALALEERLRGFLDAHIAPLGRAGYSDPALDKTLAAIGGWAPIGTRVRWPHRWVPPEVIPALRAVAEAAVPELFDDFTHPAPTSRKAGAV